MFKSYFKTAWRSIRNHKAFALINILGLAIGMAVTLVIALWVNKEYSYNKFLPGHEDVAQVRLNHLSDGKIHNMAAVSLPLADKLKNDIPELKYVAETDWNDNHSLMNGEKKLFIRGMRVGKDFLKILQYPLASGAVETVFSDPYSIILTQSTAKALFGVDDPVGKMIKYDNAHNLKVTGILKDIPENSSIRFNYLIPFKFREQTTDWIRDARTQWPNNSFQIFTAWQPGIDRAAVDLKVKELVKKNSSMKSTDVILHPLTKWELYADFVDGRATGGFIEYVRLFSLIGLLVLMLACINFMNLTTARSEKRAREVGLRKAIGSHRKNLIFQFLTESILVTFIASLLSLLLVQLSLPFFNELTKSSLSIPFSNAWFWFALAIFVLFTGLIAGSRPAFYLSSFQPVEVLRGAFHARRAAILPRKMLVVLQFACSIALIICTIIIYKQVQFSKSRTTGYDANRLVMTDMSDDLNDNYTVLKEEMMKSGAVESVTWSSSPITSIYFHTVLSAWPGKLADQEELNIGALGVDADYFKTLGMDFKSGRDFNSDWKSDSGTIILNEAAVRKLNLKEPLNQMITWNGGDKSRIIAVVKDVLMESPFTPVAPTVFMHGRHGSSIMYRLSSSVKTQDALGKLGKIFNKYNPAYPYSYLFVNDEYASKFELEVLIGKLAALFASLAIFISCLGLFGLAAFLAQQRNKEIGIRKVLGATVMQLWILLSKEFLLLVTISLFIAVPVSYYVMHNWLENYSYRTDISFWIFAAAGLSAIIITLITVSFQAIKAAITNPVKSLRSE